MNKTLYPNLLKQVVQMITEEEIIRIIENDYQRMIV